MMSLSDSELLRKCRIHSNDDAFTELVSRHGGMVHRTCTRILRDPGAADDVTQECFVKLWQVKKVRGDSLGGLLHTLATHLALNRLRAESRRREREIAYATGKAEDESGPWADMLLHVDEAIADLPDKLRRPIILHYLEGQTYAAIARSLQIDESTVRYRANKALERMRRFMKRRGVALGSGALASALEAERAHAAGLPASLQAALGKLAVAGRPLSVTAAPLVGSVAMTMGGVALMWKNALIVLAVLVAVSGFYFVFGVPVTHHARKEAAQTMRIPPVKTPDTATVSETPASNPPRPQSTALPDSPDVIKQLMAIATQQRAQEAATEPKTITSADIPTDNGAHYFLLAAELLPDIDMSALGERWKALKQSGNIEDPGFLATLARCQDALDAIRMGLQVGNVQMPTLSDWLNVNMDMRHLPSFHSLGIAFAIEAEYYALHGDYRMAFEDYRAVLAFGSESSRGGVSLGNMAGQFIEKTATQSLQDSLSYGTATPEEYRYLIQAMAKLDESRYSMTECMADECPVVATWLAKQLAAGKGPGPVVLPDESARDMQGFIEKLAAEQRQWEEYCALPYYEAVSVDLDALLGKDAAVHTLFPECDWLVAKEAETQTQIRGTMLSAAIDCYRAETGVYPGTLSSLVPDYVPSLLTDPFSGQSFQYAPTDSGYLLYSAGPDMRADGGVPLTENGAFQERTGDIIIHNE